MVTVSGVQSGRRGDEGLIGALAVEDAVAAGADGSQGFRGQGLQPRLRALRLHDERPLTVLPRTPLITTRAQTGRADYVVREPGLPSRQAARQRRVLVLQFILVT